jgi:hypothetical protein
MNNFLFFLIEPSGRGKKIKKKKIQKKNRIGQNFISTHSPHGILRTYGMCSYGSEYQADRRRSNACFPRIARRIIPTSRVKSENPYGKTIVPAVSDSQKQLVYFIKQYNILLSERVYARKRAVHKRGRSLL